MVDVPTINLFRKSEDWWNEDGVVRHELGLTENKNSWYDVDGNIRRMDQLYQSSFYTWLKNEQNVEIIGARLFRIANMYPLDRIINAMRWLTKDWSVENTAFLFKMVTKNWAISSGTEDSLSMCYFRDLHETNEEMMVEAMIFIASLTLDWDFMQLSDLFSYLGGRMGLDYRCKVEMLQSKLRRTRTILPKASLSKRRTSKKDKKDKSQSPLNLTGVQKNIINPVIKEIIRNQESISKNTNSLPEESSGKINKPTGPATNNSNNNVVLEGSKPEHGTIESKNEDSQQVPIQTNVLKETSPEVTLDNPIKTPIVCTRSPSPESPSIPPVVPLLTSNELLAKKRSVSQYNLTGASTSEQIPNTSSTVRQNSTALILRDKNAYQSKSHICLSLLSSKEVPRIPSESEIESQYSDSSVDQGGMPNIRKRNRTGSISSLGKESPQPKRSPSAGRNIPEFEHEKTTEMKTDLGKGILAEETFDSQGTQNVNSSSVNGQNQFNGLETYSISPGTSQMISQFSNTKMEEDDPTLKHADFNSTLKSIEMGSGRRTSSKLLGKEKMHSSDHLNQLNQKSEFSENSKNETPNSHKTIKFLAGAISRKFRPTTLKIDDSNKQESDSYLETGASSSTSNRTLWSADEFYSNRVPNSGKEIETTKKFEGSEGVNKKTLNPPELSIEQSEQVMLFEIECTDNEEDGDVWLNSKFIENEDQMVCREQCDFLLYVTDPVVVMNRIQEDMKYEVENAVEYDANYNLQDSMQQEYRFSREGPPTAFEQMRCFHRHLQHLQHMQVMCIKNKKTGDYECRINENDYATQHGNIPIAQHLHPHPHLRHYFHHHIASTSSVDLSRRKSEEIENTDCDQRQCDEINNYLHPNSARRRQVRNCVHQSLSVLGISISKENKKR
ncbi:hypothetical protein BB560_004573 [Smittium megazygosporum]|uniref:Uncharacterized protein n=1 Tax=Smittium megazygosporum TaxID=133381 RepID=A0A2T9Z909_9FUNG|nr:hypothetical protein BB560_004573 [Smittium megazygosporum]